MGRHLALELAGLQPRHQSHCKPSLVVANQMPPVRTSSTIATRQARPLGIDIARLAMLRNAAPANKASSSPRSSRQLLLPKRADPRIGQAARSQRCVTIRRNSKIVTAAAVQLHEAPTPLHQHHLGHPQHALARSAHLPLHMLLMRHLASFIRPRRRPPVAARSPALWQGG